MSSDQKDTTPELDETDLESVAGGQQGGTNMQISGDGPKTSAPVYPE